MPSYEPFWMSMKISAKGFKVKVNPEQLNRDIKNIKNLDLIYNCIIYYFITEFEQGNCFA